MTFLELKEKLGACGRSHMLSAYSKDYYKQAQHRNSEVTPEKAAKIIESINQHVKELKGVAKELKKHLSSNT